MRIRSWKNKKQDPKEIAERIIEYELGAPKLDIYTATICVKKWWCPWLTWEIERQFIGFGDAYLWMLNNAADFRKKSVVYFFIHGNKAIESAIPENWHDLPFNRDDCCEIYWGFDKDCKLNGRDYFYEGFSKPYMPSDVADDAGTHFKPGDLVKNRETVYVLTGSPGTKGVNRWENYYCGLEVCKIKEGSFYTSHSHFYETDLVEFEGEIDKFGLLWFLHKIISDLVAGETKMSEDEVWSYVDADVELINGEWKVVGHACDRLNSKKYEE